MVGDRDALVWLVAGLVAELLQRTVAVAPVFHHLDIQVEETFLASEFLNVFACLNSHLLDGFALMADKDGALRFSFHIDNRTDIVHTLFLFIALHSHFAAVRNLFLVVEQQFLPNNLADKETHGAVGQFVFRAGSRAVAG